MISLIVNLTSVVLNQIKDLLNQIVINVHSSSFKELYQKYDDVVRLLTLSLLISFKLNSNRYMTLVSFCRVMSRLMMMSLLLPCAL